MSNRVKAWSPDIGDPVLLATSALETSPRPSPFCNSPVPTYSYARDKTPFSTCTWGRGKNPEAIFKSSPRAKTS